MSNNYDYLETSLCEIIEDYGLFPAFEKGSIVWNVAVFPRAGKREKFCEIMKELNIPVVSDSKKGPRIKQVKECFVFDNRKFPRIAAKIAETMRSR